LLLGSLEERENFTHSALFSRSFCHPLSNFPYKSRKIPLALLMRKRLVHDFTNRFNIMKISILHGSLVGTVPKYLLFLFALMPLQSFALIWTGGDPAGSNWINNLNWGGTQIAKGDDLVFAGNVQVVNTNGTSPRTSYNSITFDPTAGPFVLTGNLLNIANGITNDSFNVEIVDLGITFSNNITLDGESNTLYVLAGLTNSVSQPAATIISLTGKGVLDNLFTGDYYPLETNIFATVSNANWTLQDNPSSTIMTGPWIFQINSGTFNFGSISSAPKLTSTTLEGSPLDHEIGSVSGATGVFNVVNGSLTTSSAVRAATAAGSTAIINVSGGTLSVSNGLCPLYVASSGTGVLTMVGGTVNCGILDLSGNAAGNTSSSAGTVHLDGGTLMVTTVTNASANPQPGGNPTATFYFNGGTLMTTSIITRVFFQGSQTVPVMPIAAIVQTGGAFIDVKGGHSFPVSLGEPLQHDPALGSAKDGGLTKTDLATLVLLGTNTYNGDTTIIGNGTANGGWLALRGSASIANSANIIVGGGTKFDVLGLSPAFVLSSGQTLSNSSSTAVITGNFNTGFGTVAFNYSAGSPSFMLTNGFFTFSPGTVVKVNNAGAPLTRGVYTLISTNFIGSSNPSFVLGSLPSSFTLGGGGIAPGNTASLQISHGNLNLVVAPPTPRFTSVSLQGTALTLTATNGATSGQYILLESTNLLTPLNLWKPVLTNNFDSSGNLNLTTNIVSPNNPTEFYILSQ
jgi:autotransporter-associated beta strand protein